MRPIDADALMELARNHVNRTVDCNDIARFPTIDVAPVVHARWGEEDNGYRDCSNCCCEHPIRDAKGYLVDDEYCPRCGAKMDAKE